MPMDTGWPCEQFLQSERTLKQTPVKGLQITIIHCQTNRNHQMNLNHETSANLAKKLFGH